MFNSKSRARHAARCGAAAFCSLLAAAALAQSAPQPESAAPSPVVPAASANVARAFVVTPGDGRVGTFKTVQGQITLIRDDTHRAAVVGGSLLPGEKLKTGPDSVAVVTLRDGTVLTLGPDSSLDLAEFDFNSTTHEGSLWVRLARGSLRMVSGLIAKLQPEKVKVTTPTAVIGVRGTDFIVEARP